MSISKIRDWIQTQYFPLFYSSTIFLDQRAGEILCTFVTLEELLSAPVSATGVHLLQTLETSNETCRQWKCSKAVIITCEERPGTVRLVERIKKTLQYVETLLLLTNWTKEDAISYEQVLLDSYFEQEKSIELGCLNILEDLDKEPYERTANELKVYYGTSQVDISYAPFIGVACPMDNLFITASKDSDQPKLLIDQESWQVEGISQLSEPLRSILASIARNMASFYSCTRLRPMKTFSSGPLSKLVIEQFQRCATRANEEMKQISQNMTDEKDSYLLVVDRTFILSESFHMKESLLERMFSFYPHRCCFDFVSSFSPSYATQLWKLRNHLENSDFQQVEQLYSFCNYGEYGQGLLEECRLDREDSHLARKLLMSLSSVDVAEQSISIIHELLIHILKDIHPSVDYSSRSLLELLEWMKQEKAYDERTLSDVYRLVWEIAMIAYTVLESSPLARLWNQLKQVMDNMMQSEMKNSWMDSSNLLLSLLDGIQSVVDSCFVKDGTTTEWIMQSIQSIDLFQSILILVTWVYLTPSFRKLESTEEDILIDTLVHLMDEECKEFLQSILLVKNEREGGQVFWWKMSSTLGPSRQNNGNSEHSKNTEQVGKSDSYSSLIRKFLSILSYISNYIRSHWNEEGETMPLLFRRMISQFPDFRMPSLIHIIGKLKEIREEESFGLKLEYIPSQYLGERLLSGLQRFRTKPFGASGTGGTQKTLVVFVVGGICLSEIACVESFVKEFFSDDLDEIIFGSTHLTSAMEMLYLSMERGSALE